MRHIDTQIMALRQEFITMGLEVLEAVKKTVTAFEEGNEKLAQEVIDHDEVINGKETHLEKKSAQVIALQQPVTMDLREIISILKASADLERLADHAVNISETVLDLNLHGRNEQIDELLTRMGENVAKMLQDILDAYTEVDDGHAVEIAERDATNDEIYSKVNTLSVKLLQTSPENTVEGIDYLKIANRLERIGDYITNIAEWIVYTKRGKIVELGKKDI
ncbi:MAG: phosphate signaling complex protein PhoU [Lactobacillus ruminis]|nr:phosphate signaling complex protein PhoU [Ligilactobacillus ruminis]